jgi:hypothetical protein
MRKLRNSMDVARMTLDPIVEIDLECRLSRKHAAAALTAKGFPTAEATLATIASRGGGPPFSKFGTRVVYRWGDLLSWAKGRLTGPINSTSELRQTPGTERGMAHTL